MRIAGFEHCIHAIQEEYGEPVPCGQVSLRLFAGEGEKGATIQGKKNQGVVARVPN